MGKVRQLPTKERLTRHAAVIVVEADNDCVGSVVEFRRYLDFCGDVICLWRKGGGQPLFGALTGSLSGAQNRVAQPAPVRAVRVLSKVVSDLGQTGIVSGVSCDHRTEVLGAQRDERRFSGSARGMRNHGGEAAVGERVRIRAD